MITIGSFIFFTVIIAVITYFMTRGENLKSSDGYYLGGRSLTAVVIASSLLLTNLSASNFIGLSSLVYRTNMSPMGWAVSSALPLVLVALVLLPKYLKQGITTIPEFIASRFDKGTAKFVTILFLCSYILNTLPITLYSGSIAMSQLFDFSGLFGISYKQGIWIMVWIIGIIGSIYAIFGGLKAVAVSDTINGIALLVGSILIPICALVVIGKGNIGAGFHSFLASSPEKFNAIGASDSPLPFGAMFSGLLLVNLYCWGTNQSIIQRALGAKNLVEGQKGMIYAGFLKILTPFILCIPGIMAYQILGGGITNKDTVYPLLVNAVLPKPLVGFFAAAMMGAILSTFNSVLNSASTLFALNVYKPIWGKNKSDTELVKAGKIFGTIVAVVSMFVAPAIMNAPKGLYEYAQTINGFFNVPIFTIIFLGYLTKRVPPIAAKVGLVFFVTVYGITQLFWDTGIHYLYISAILFVITCAIMIIIGKIKPMEKEFVLPDNKLVDTTVWNHRYIASGIVLFAMVAMYIIFSKVGLYQPGGLGLNTVIWLTVSGVVLIGVPLIIENYDHDHKHSQSHKTKLAKLITKKVEG